MGLSWQDLKSLLSCTAVPGGGGGGQSQWPEGARDRRAQRSPRLALPKHVLREGVWSGGEGPGPLVAILWFPFWHLLLSVLWALLTLPTLVSSAIKTERQHAYVCGGRGRNAGGLAGCPLGWLGTLGSGGARVDKGIPGDLDLNLLLAPHLVDKDTMLKSLPRSGASVSTWR